MTVLQDDLLEIYNSLVVFSDIVLKSPTSNEPIVVKYEPDSRLLTFEYKGVSARLWNPVYYCLGLTELTKETYLLPEDYDSLMYNLQQLINSGELIKDRVILSPENYGFDVYATNPKEIWKGPDIVGSVRFVSGNSWLFKLLTKFKYR